MQVEALALALRQRPMLEAADLGAALVRRHARSVWRCFTPLLALVTVLALAGLAVSSWLPVIVLFWLKPWLDRSLLFVLARAVFGQPTRWADLWQARAQVWRGRWLDTLLGRRLSPWRAFTQPIAQLEGQRGKALRQRRRLLLRGHRGAALWNQSAFGSLELALQLGLFAAAMWFAPAHSAMGLVEWLARDDLSDGLVTACAYALVVLVLEPFHVAAGFAMYLNRRVELEAWDIEQEFRHAFAH